MSDLKALLERADRAVSDVPLPADGLEGLERRRDRKRRNQRIAAGVVGIAVFVAAVWAVTTGGSFNRTQQPAIQPTPTPEPSMTAPEVAYLIDLNTGEMTPLPESILGGSLYMTSPDRTMLAYSECCVTVDRMNRVFVANVDGTGVRQITANGFDGFAPRWSPDGSMLVYQQRGGLSLGTKDQTGNLFVVDVATGEATRIGYLDPDHYGWYGDATTPPPPLHPSFSPDGQTIIFHMPKDPNDDVNLPLGGFGPGPFGGWDLWSVPVGGGEPTLVVHNASWGVYAPDGGTLAYLDSPRGDWTSSRLMVADVDGSDPRLLVQGTRIEFPRWSPDGTRIAYTDTDGIHVVDVSTGETSLVAEGGTSDWFGDDALVVVP